MHCCRTDLDTGIHWVDDTLSGQPMSIVSEMVDESLQGELPAHWNTLLDLSGEAFVLADAEGRIVLFSRGAEAMFGVPRGDARGRLIETLMPSRFRRRHGQLMRAFRHDARVPRLMGERTTVTGLRRSGEEFPAEASVAWLPKAGVGAGVYAVILRDISDRALWHRDATRLSRIIEGITDEIYVFELQGWSLLQVNRSARDNLGYNIDDLMQMTLLDVQPTFTPRSFASFIQPLVEGKVAHLRYESIHQRRNGSTYDVEVRIERIQDQHPPLLFAIVRDVTENKRIEAIIQRQSHYDPVTMLPNRPALVVRTEQAAREAVARGQAGALIVIGLEKTEMIRDGLGSSAGESIAQQIGIRLTDAVSGRHTVARIGDAEFAVLVPTLAAPQEAEAIVQDILAGLVKPMPAQDLTLVLQARVGIALFPDNGTEGDELLRQAHGALLQARSEDRIPYHFATPGLNRAMGQRIRMESALGRALERDEFFLAFQPTVRASDLTICGVEALLRWAWAEGGVVPPGTFVPILEETGLIHGVGNWVLRAALMEAGRLRREGFDGLTMAVNLSMRQLTPGLPQLLQTYLAEAGLPGDAVTLELTETSLMRHVDEALAILKRIADLGVGLAIDDFGCGYSSLSYLRRLPLTTLKIDRSFVRDMDSNPDAAAIAKTIVAMAQALRLHTVAEGVETEAQVRQLRNLGCDALQGFHLYRPLSVDALRGALAEAACRQGAGRPTAARSC